MSETPKRAPFPVCTSCGKSTRSHARPRYCAACGGAVASFARQFGDAAPNTPERREQILAALLAFASQRPGIEPGNYASFRDYRNESAQVTRDLHDVRALLAAVRWRTSIDAQALRAACRGAFSGRVTLHETDTGVSVSYCTGQYFPTEYRRAVACVLGSALWDYFRDHCAPADVTAGWVRDMARRELGARLQRKYCD